MATQLEPPLGFAPTVCAAAGSLESNQHCEPKLSFVSFAQNREDVLLWRALGHVGAGFYVDVGANDPDADSITRAFYDRGWSGINIEPIARHCADLRRRRPRDINLQLAAGASAGAVDIYDTPVRGLASASPAVAQLLRTRGLAATPQRVLMQRLDSILEQHAPAEVHFLKIDVEGFEAEVLRGMNFDRWRPWVVVIEATRPNSSELDADWAPMLLNKGYDCVYFDGLNQFYLAHEHRHLGAAFATPVNVFDQYVPWVQVQLQADAECGRLAQRQLQAAHGQLHAEHAQLQARHGQLHAEHAQLQATHGQLHSEHAQLQAAFAALQQQLDAVYASSSWRLSMPVRWLGHRLRPVRAQANVAQHLPPPPAAVRPPPETAEATEVTTKKQQVTSRSRLAQLASSAWVTPMRPWLHYLPEPDAAALPPELQLRLIGHVQGHYSLAAVNRRLALALAQLCPQQVQWVGCDGQALQADLAGFDWGDANPTEQGQLLALLQHAPSTADAAHTVSVVHHYPPLADPLPARLRLALFFWEEGLLPPALLAHLLAHTDAVLVASHFVLKVLRHSGYHKPIHVLPLGLPSWALNAPFPQALRRPKAGQAFRFLHLSSAFARKGVDVLLRAFYARFTADDGVELYIKSHPNEHHDLATELQHWRQNHPCGPKVLLDLDNLDASGLHALYESAHALVLPSRGEGFGLPAAEALSLGLPLITTGWGGQCDFANPFWTAVLPFKLQNSSSHVRSTGSYWAEPCPHALALLLGEVKRQVLDHRSGLLQRLQAAAQWVRAHHQSEVSAQALLAAVQRCLPSTDPTCSHPAPKPRLRLLSPWQTSCGIAEYAQALLNDWNAEFDLQVWCDMRTQPDPNQGLFFPSWRMGDNASVLALLHAELARPAEQRCTVLLLMHQPSLYALDADICLALAQLQASGIEVLVLLHTVWPLARQQRLCSASATALRQIGALVVHQLDDANTLLALGLNHNVVRLQHGATLPSRTLPAPDRGEIGWDEHDWVLACFGLLLPHKGLDVVLDAMPLLAQASGRRVRLIALNAAVDERSLITLATCQQQAQRLGLSADVLWLNDFAPLHDRLRWLQMADVVVFAYDHTDESASGAITVGLASKRPVIASNSKIFSDAADCIVRLEQRSPNALAHAIQKLLSSPDALEQQLQRQQEWLEAHTWPVISQRWRATIHGLLNDPKLSKLPADAWPTQGYARELLVDVTAISLHDAGTGIQRTVRSVLQQWQLHCPDGWLLRPVRANASGDGYCYCNFLNNNTRNQPDLEGQPVNPVTGDVFVGLDLSAHLFPSIEPELLRWRLAGVQICFVVYDILPLFQPQWFEAYLPSAFESWMQGLARHAERLVCISRSVAHDVHRWLLEHTPSNTVLPAINHFHLGSDLHLVCEPAQHTANPIRALLSHLQNTPWLLMVGTIEPRKNQALALAAFELLWKQGCPMQLVMIGRQGWLMDEFCTRLRLHPEHGHRLHWLEHADDAALTLLYRHASALLAASEAEGFGLPLIEAAQFGLPIIARDIAVFRELTQGHAFFFADLNNPDNLATALQSWLYLHQNGQEPASKSIKWQDWKASSMQLWQALQ